MKSPRPTLGATAIFARQSVRAALLVTALGFALAPSTLRAQGVTTGAVAGTITDRSGKPVEGAQVQIQNKSTGYVVGAMSRANGYFLVQSLEVGGPYTVRVRRIGYEPAERNDVMVTLSQTTRIDIQIAPTAVQLAGVEVRASAEAADFSPSRQGVGTTVVDTIIRRMPTLQRDFTDLVKLTPQVVPNAGGQGPSAAGGYNRLNNFTVDGANQNDRFNLGASGGQPGGATGGRIMSQEAVKEFQVLMSPTDVRYGNFAGMLVNAVTKNGTNDWTGGATYTFRTPDMAANKDLIRSSGFKIKQYGFTLGGPIIRDKLHFFVAPEWQDRTDPTTGPIISTNASNQRVVGTTNVSVSLDSINAIAGILGPRFEVGSMDAFSRGNPLTNLMGRLDWSINDVNRFVFRMLDNTAEQVELARGTQGLASNAGTQSTGLRFTSNSFTRQAKNRSLAGQFFSNFSNGTANEVLIGYNTIRDLRIVPVNAPEISVGVTPVGGGTLIAVTAGTERFSPGNDLQQKIFEVSDNLTMPLGTSHTVTAGTRYERAYIYNYFLSGAGNGAFSFPNIAALQAGNPSSYAFSYANGGDIAAKFKGQQMSFYIQDLWNVTSRFSINGGVRIDVPTFLDTPKENQMITDSAATIRTDWKPKTQVMWSPRLGFNWDVFGTQETQLRGNIGIYTGAVPYILVGNAYANTGLGGVTVACTAAGTVPAFTTDVSQLPKSCAGQPAPQPGAAGTVGVNVTDPNFKYPQNFTTSLGFDHRFPWDIVGTFEGLYRKEINGLYVRDLNLIGPRLVNGQAYTDVNGRILYADTITVANNGSLTVDNARQKEIVRIGPAASSVAFSEGAIMLTNAKAGYNYALSAQFRKRFSRDFEATAAYTFQQSRDVQSLTSDRAISNWRFGRQFAGLENDPSNATVSNFQRPHRFIGYGTWTGPWRKYATDVTFFYELMSGMSFTYVTNNDINGDGIAGNDPIYVPRNATDPNEIRIGTGTGTAFALNQAAAQAFDRFIDLQPCVDKQRGSIMKRNSCQAPFTRRMDLSIRQTLPEVSGQRLTAQLDVFNFLNLVNNKWGQNQFPVGGTFNNQTALNTASRQPGALGTALWNYNMPAPLLNNINNLDSPWSLNQNTPANNYQLQLTVRYAF
jgi:hypothetical protein